MFWQKKSVQPTKPKHYISFYISEENDLKIEFGFENISTFISMADTIINGSIRHPCIKTIYTKMKEGGLIVEANEFASKINDSIKPSEYTPQRIGGIMLPDRKIAWEQWVDFEQEPKSLLDDEDGEDGEEFEIYPIMLRTPLGLYSPLEPMNPTKMFDCWTAHTNFPITRGDVMVLDEVLGIEALKVMTKYRFFIGIGKLFSLTDVRPRVEQALNIGGKSIISEIMNQISGKKKWAVCIYKDGSYRSISSDIENDCDYDKKLSAMKESDIANIITSDEF